MNGFIEIVPSVRIKSPCTNVCRIDAESGLCKGCARTLNEIVRWTAMNDAERADVMRDLRLRQG